MSLWLRNLILMALMLATAGLGFALQPTLKIADQGPKIDLELMIPATFADWKEEHHTSTPIIDPLQQKNIDKIYSKTLSRTYINPKGYRIMLSVAYGEDQRDAMQTHYPEVCYPAQGFQVISKHRSVLELESGKLPLKLLETALGEQRYEPVTYWTMIGDVAVLDGTEKKLQEIRYGLRGEIPDGLLFRVSSIENDSPHAFKIQESFISEMLTAMPPETRKRFSGI